MNSIMALICVNLLNLVTYGTTCVKQVAVKPIMSATETLPKESRFPQYMTYDDILRHYGEKVHKERYSTLQQNLTNPAR